MTTICNVCQGTGFINIPTDDDDFETDDFDLLKKFIETKREKYPDFSVCSCCGNGEDWYGEPGQHYSSQDPIGRNGPYAYNGGLCECH